jgi:small GTP-binding protein
MLQKKICMLGAFSVGKTSLVRRFVESTFSDRYLTTVGVKIDKKPLEVNGRALDLILWDIAGEDEVSAIRISYLRGSAGYLMVADGTRPVTLDVARSLHRRVEAELGPVPFVLLLNKRDLADDWCVPAGEVAALRQSGWSVRLTSAKTGEGVQDAFAELAGRVIA